MCTNYVILCYNTERQNNAFGGQNVLGQAGFFGKPLPGSSFYEPEVKRSARRERDSDIEENEDNLEYVYEDGTTIFQAFCE